MADIYTVLANSLRKRNIQNPAVREDVYVRARVALIRRLWAHRPRLSNRQIEDMMAVFDLAVAFVESDVTQTLPATGRQKRDRETAARLFRQRQIANLNFDFSVATSTKENRPRRSARLSRSRRAGRRADYAMDRYDGSGDRSAFHRGAGVRARTRR
jgi:hypothetical protein